MVAVRLEGRLGNQLFQYAFIYTAAKKLNTKFYLDKSVDKLLLDKYFNIPVDFCRPFDNYLFSIPGFKNLFTYHLKQKFYNLLKHISSLQTVSFDSNKSPSLQMGLIRNNCLYLGHFQSEEYFEKSRGLVTGLFKIKPAFSKEFEGVIARLDLPADYVAVHIRRGDYISHNIALDYAYFHKAIASIHKEENFYIFISDEPHIIYEEFKSIKKKYVSDNTEIVDFQFLTNASVCILSNSSFSWWGAYLNTKSPYVIAPQYWLGFKEKAEIPAGIIPERFSTLVY